MLGLGLAGIYAIICWVTNTAPETTFRKSTNFLFWWYLITTCIAAVIILLVFTGIGVFWGLSGGNYETVFTGGLVGSGIGFLFVALFFIFGMLAIVGAHLLRTSVREENGAFQWDKKRLIAGSILLGISVLMTLGAN